MTATSVVRVSALIVGSQVGGSFALFTAFLLVTVEDLGVERRTALPISESVRTLSKVLVSTLTYLPVPLALSAILLFIKPPTFGGGIFIPVAAVASVFTACVVEVTVLNTLADWGRGTAVRFIAGVGSGELIMVIPSFAFTLEYVATHDRTGALLVLLLASDVEYLLLHSRTPRAPGEGVKPMRRGPRLSVRRRRKARPTGAGRGRIYALVAVGIVAVVILGFVLLVPRGGTAQSASTTTTPSGVTSTSSSPTSKPIILYVNQGNGVVNQSNFGALVAFASSQGFNTLFFQVYREGNLLFTPSQLTSFVAQAHDGGLKIFFSLYITDPSQQMPASIYALGEDGISLDMSSLTVSSQESFYSDLSAAYSGTKAITTTT